MQAEYCLESQGSLYETNNWSKTRPIDPIDSHRLADVKEDVPWSKAAKSPHIATTKSDFH